MRRVKITYNDGRIEEFKSVKEAAEHLRCSYRRIERMEAGRGGVIRRHHDIASVETSEPVDASHRRLGRKCGGRPTPVRCINQATGEVLVCKSIKEARLTTHAPYSIHYHIGDGLYHWGWRYEVVEDDDYEQDRATWRDPVSDDLIHKVYIYAYHYLRPKYEMQPEDKEDIVQHIVNRVCSDVSIGMYEQYRARYTFDLFLTLRVRHWGWTKVRKWYRDYRRTVDKPDNIDMDKDEWLANVAGCADADKDIDRYVAGLPEQYQTLARMLIEGRSSSEIIVGCGIPEDPKVLARLKRELGAWLLRRRQEEDGDEEG